MASCAWKFESQSFPAEHVIDSTDASDAFNADLIQSLVNHTELQSSSTYACRLVGHKCGQVGFDYLKLALITFLKLSKVNFYI
jgi:sugar/nucleoside kinase (ribokinase family)